MTFSTSAVAVCRSSDPRSSLSSRVFSIAMTAWAAKFWTSSICLSVTVNPDCADQLIVFEHRHGNSSPKSAEVDGSYKNGFALDVGRFHFDISDMDRLPRFNNAAESGSRTRPVWSVLPERMLAARRT